MPCLLDWCSLLQQRRSADSAGLGTFLDMLSKVVYLPISSFVYVSWDAEIELLALDLSNKQQLEFPAH